MAKEIAVTVFGREMKARESGRKFMRYWTTLPGDDSATRVKFQQECGAPQELPAIILLARGDCNIKVGSYTDAAGEEHPDRTLWIKNWTPSGEVFVDHSMDDYFGTDDE